MLCPLLEGYLYPKEGSNNSKCVPNYHRPAPIIWERPHFQQWEPDPPPPPSCNYNYHGSRDELRALETYHRRHHDFYRYDSDGMLSAPPGINENGRCCNRYMAKSAAPPSCCSCECRSVQYPSVSSSLSSWEKKYQVQN